MSSVHNDLLGIIVTYTTPSVTDAIITLSREFARRYGYNSELWRQKVAVEQSGLVFEDSVIESIGRAGGFDAWYLYYRQINKHHYGGLGLLWHTRGLEGIGTNLIGEGTGIWPGQLITSEYSIEDFVVSLVDTVPVVVRSSEIGDPNRRAILGSGHGKLVQVMGFYTGDYYVLTERGELWGVEAGAARRKIIARGVAQVNRGFSVLFRNGAGGVYRNPIGPTRDVAGSDKVPSVLLSAFDDDHSYTRSGENQGGTELGGYYVKELVTIGPGALILLSGKIFFYAGSDPHEITPPKPAIGLAMPTVESAIVLLIDGTVTHYSLVARVWTPLLPNQRFEVLAGTWSHRYSYFISAGV